MSYGEAMLLIDERTLLKHGARLMHALEESQELISQAEGAGSLAVLDRLSTGSFGVVLSQSSRWRAAA